MKKNITLNNPVKITLVTTCKGRLAYLRESLPTWLDLDYDNYEIFVVDYDCPDGTEAYIDLNRERMLQHSKAAGLHVVKVHNKPRFNLCDARNHGIDSADSELILMIDADVHITDKDMLNRVSRRYKEGIVFFSNVTVLSTRFSEGLEFYKLKYGIRRILFHSLLPTHSREVGLSGTACFKKNLYRDCGKYRPEINRRGWGSDDIEFYIRYLDHYVYNVLLKEKPGTDSNPAKYLDTALKRVDFFPPGSFELVENTEEEKTRFYDNPQVESSRLNKTFIRKLLEEEGDRYGWIKRENTDDEAISILKYRRYEKFPIPPWFNWWYNYWAGQKLLQLERPREAVRLLKPVLKEKNIEPLFLARACFLIADAYEKTGKMNWKYYYRQGLHFLAQKRDQTREEIYTAASLLERLNRDEEAIPLFRQLIKGDKVRDLWDGCYFHLGEIMYRRKQFKEAEAMFRETLKINPAHGKAGEFLEELKNR